MATGYGPSGGQKAGRWDRLVFSGEPGEFEAWSVKMLGYFRLRKLHHVFVTQADRPTDYDEKNKDVFAELIQFLDDRSLALVLSKLRDARDDGQKAWEVLHEHYSGKSKPRIISLYTELTSLVKNSDESVTDYTIRAERTACALKEAGETVSDSLCVAMILKGLPSSYKPFVTVVTQRKDDLSLQELKVMLKGQEEIENQEQTKNDECTLALAKFKPDSNPKSTGRKNKVTTQASGQQSKFKGKCFNCGLIGHMSKDCLKPKKEKQRTDNAAAKAVNDFNFKLSENGNTNFPGNAFLVDCGATSHIITDEKLFVSFDDSFNSDTHYVELADGTRHSGMAKKRGTALITLVDKQGVSKTVKMDNALLIPDYSTNILAVQCTASKGATFTFGMGNADITMHDGTKFEILMHDRLYYLPFQASQDAVNRVLDMSTWHEIYGHCNEADLRKLVKHDLVTGMQLSDKKSIKKCETCVMNKLPNFRNHAPRTKATRAFQLVHSDLTAQINPVGKHSFKYAMNFVDDFSGFVFMYMLRSKADATVALKQFLVDVKPFGQVQTLRSDNGTEYTCESFENVLRDARIKHEFSAPYSSHQNGTAERNWRTIFSMARCMLNENRLPKSLWPYAVMHTTCIRH